MNHNVAEENRMEHRRPIIAVMPLFDDERDSLWMLPGYFDGITEAGGLPIMLCKSSLTNINMLQ